MFPIQEDKAAPSRPRAFPSANLLCAVLLMTMAVHPLRPPSKADIELDRANVRYWG